MILLVLSIGIICIILFVNNIISIMHKVRDGKEDTIKNTFVCCITLIYLWISTIFLSGI
ncbi:hypothetical protein UT300007_17300 [Clostridium sp. CTA-7]